MKFLYLDSHLWFFVSSIWAVIALAECEIRLLLMLLRVLVLKLRSAGSFEQWVNLVGMLSGIHRSVLRVVVTFPRR